MARDALRPPVAADRVTEAPDGNLERPDFDRGRLLVRPAEPED